MNHKDLFRVDALPVFQNRMFEDKQAAISCVKGNMRLVQNLDTGLIYKIEFDPSLLKYDAHYQNEQACSDVFRQHLNNVKAIIERNMLGKSLLEVGCGKAYFLEFLQNYGFDIMGIDPAYEGSNPQVIKALFEPARGLSRQGIILRHVLEHIQNPMAFLEAIANGGKGLIYIEVPCFDWICEHKAWFDIFYEHVNYFRLSDFNKIFSTIHDADKFLAGSIFMSLPSSLH